MAKIYNNNNLRVSFTCILLIIVASEATNSSFVEEKTNKENVQQRLKRQLFSQRGPFRRPEFFYPNDNEFDSFAQFPQQLEFPQAQTQEQQQQSRQRRQFNNELIFSNNGPTSTPSERSIFPETTIAPINGNDNDAGQLVFINNRPTIVTMPPFSEPTMPTPTFLRCYHSCQTTPEYNPICGSNRQLYFNEQKFNCARRCGADIEIVRRGSCEGLFPVSRG